MISWPEGFCAELAGRGVQVIRFDNRDAGRSSHWADAPPRICRDRPDRASPTALKRSRPACGHPRLLNAGRDEERDANTTVELR